MIKKKLLIYYAIISTSLGRTLPFAQIQMGSSTSLMNIGSTANEWLTKCYRQLLQFKTKRKTTGEYKRQKLISKQTFLSGWRKNYSFPFLTKQSYLNVMYKTYFHKKKIPRKIQSFISVLKCHNAMRHPRKEVRGGIYSYFSLFSTLKIG